VNAAAGIDFTSPTTQRNLVGYYLVAGDMITVHVVEAEGPLRIDWIARQGPK